MEKANHSLMEVKSIIRALLTSCRRIRVQSLRDDYIQSVGEPIPHAMFGYQTLYNFLCSMPDTLRVYGSPTNAVVEAIVIPSQAHIHDMIQRQRPTRPRNIKGRRKQNYPENVQYNAPANTRQLGVKQHINMMNPMPAPVPRENKRPASGKWAVPESAKSVVPESTKSVVPERTIVKQVPKQENNQPDLGHATCDQTNETVAPSTNCGSEKNWNNMLSLPPNVMNLSSAKLVVQEKTIYKQVPKQENSQPYLGRATCDHTNETVATRTNCGSEKDWINMLSLPPNVMNLSSNIPEPDLSTFATRGSLIMLYVLNVFNPNRIWVRSSFHMAMFKKLQEELDQEYNTSQHYDRSSYLTKETAQRGLYCAALWEGSWYRAKIVGPLMGESVKLNLIDLGQIETVNISKLRYLASIFSKPEVLVVRASLAYLVPRKHFWRRADSDHLQKMLLKSELFCATIVNFDEMNNAIEIVLKDGKLTHVNQAFASDVQATWIGKDPLPDDHEAYRSRPQLNKTTFNERYPTFYCIESGHLPTMDEIRRALARNFDFEEFYTKIPHNPQVNIPEQFKLTHERIAEILNSANKNKKQAAQRDEGQTNPLPTAAQRLPKITKGLKESVSLRNVLPILFKRKL